jgi:outer membrane murein-binding lipoprotein Lpp
MSEFEDGLWERLVSDHAADHVSLTTEPQHQRRLLVGGGAAALATVSAAAVVAFSVTGGAAPAYAMTQNADGSYTFTINDLATAAPELNAKFKQLGIDETVVTASASCPATDNITGELQLDPQASSSDSMTFTPGGKNLDPGYTGVIGAEQLPDGQIAITMEAVPPADVPSCFPTRAFKLVQTGDGNGVPTVTAQQVSPTTPGG